MVLLKNPISLNPYGDDGRQAHLPRRRCAFDLSVLSHPTRRVYYRFLFAEGKIGHDGISDDQRGQCCYSSLGDWGDNLSILRTHEMTRQRLVSSLAAFFQIIQNKPDRRVVKSICKVKRGWIVSSCLSYNIAL